MTLGGVGISAVGGCAIKIASAIRNEPGIGRGSVRAASEGVENGFCPDSTRARRNFPNSAAAVTGAVCEIAAVEAGAVQISGRVEGQSTERIFAIGGAVQIVEDGFGLGVSAESEGE